MEGLAVLFVGALNYFIGWADEFAEWFEKNTRFFEKGEKIFWVAPAIVLAVCMGQYLSLHPEFTTVHSLLSSANGWTKSLFLGGLGACLPSLILTTIYLQVRGSQKDGIVLLHGSFFFLFTTLSAVTCAVASALLLGAGSGIVLPEVEAMEKAAAGGSWLPLNPNLLAQVLCGLTVALLFLRHNFKNAKHWDVVAQDVLDASMWWLNFMLRFIAPAVLILIGYAIANTDGGIQTLAGPLGIVFAAIIVGLYLHVLAVSFGVGTRVGFKRVAKFLYHMKGPLFFVWAIRSSVGGLKVTIPAAESFGLKKKYVNFILPYGATVNMDGTSVYLAVSAIAITVAVGLPITWGVFFALLMSILSASVGTAAAPSASILLMNVVFTAALTAAGSELDAEAMENKITAMIGLLMAIDPIADMFRTKVNVIGDCLCCLFLNDTEKDNDEDAAVEEESTTQQEN